MHSQEFRDACRAAKVIPTKRQASAYRNGKGAAYRFGRILKELQHENSA